MKRLESDRRESGVRVFVRLCVFDGCVSIVLF